tara:strand:- start:357 stop:560 length:204 start_codon:yes stop_codon:yes gene_type:complete
MEKLSIDAVLLIFLLTVFFVFFGYGVIKEHYKESKFNCLEQNVKGDKFKCEHHCGECVNSNHCQTQK